jgi:hypothetical protein
MQVRSDTRRGRDNLAEASARESADSHGSASARTSGAPNCWKSALVGALSILVITGCASTTKYSYQQPKVPSTGCDTKQGEIDEVWAGKCDGGVRVGAGYELTYRPPRYAWLSWRPVSVWTRTGNGYSSSTWSCSQSRSCDVGRRTLGESASRAIAEQISFDKMRAMSSEDRARALERIMGGAGIPNPLAQSRPAERSAAVEAKASARMPDAYYIGPECGSAVGRAIDQSKRALCTAAAQVCSDERDRSFPENRRKAKFEACNQDCSRQYEEDKADRRESRELGLRSYASSEIWKFRQQCKSQCSEDFLRPGKIVNEVWSVCSTMAN